MPPIYLKRFSNRPAQTPVSEACPEPVERVLRRPGPVVKESGSSAYLRTGVWNNWFHFLFNPCIIRWNKSQDKRARSMAISNSIVIVNCNTKPALLSLLKSLHLEESTSGEIIVIDCASFDGSVELAEQFPTVKFMPMKINRGFFAAANRGIDRCGGDVVVVCHADIITDIHTLSDLADQTREAAGRKIAAVFPRLKRIDDSEQGFVGKLPHLTSAIKGAFYAPAGLKCGPPTLDHLTENEWARFVCVAFNRDLLSATGLMDEKFFLYCGDTDLCARMHKKKLRIAISKDIHVRHAGAGIGKEIPSHLMRILRNDQQRYAAKHFPAWQKPLVQVMGSLGGLFNRSK